MTWYLNNPQFFIQICTSHVSWRMDVNILTHTIWQNWVSAKKNLRLLFVFILKANDLANQFFCYSIYSNFLNIEFIQTLLLVILMCLHKFYFFFNVLKEINSSWYFYLFAVKKINWMKFLLLKKKNTMS